MELDIRNDIEYKDLLFNIFNCYDIPTLQNVKDDLIKVFIKSNIHSDKIRLSRIIKMIDYYIEIINNDLSNNN
jgi:hypothetical protein